MIDDATEKQRDTIYNLAQWNPNYTLQEARDLAHKEMNVYEASNIIKQLINEKNKRNKYL